MKSLLLHTIKLSASKIKAIEAAGFICVKVESFSDTKVISDSDLSHPERILLDSALEALNYEKCKQLTMANNVLDYFNSRVKMRVLELAKKI